MTDDSETTLEQTERHAAEIEVRIARQRTCVAELERDHYSKASAEQAHRVLAAMEERLLLIRERAEIIRERSEIIRECAEILPMRPG
jgi:hypothetical protein